MAISKDCPRALLRLIPTDSLKLELFWLISALIEKKSWPSLIRDWYLACLNDLPSPKYEIASSKEVLPAPFLP